MDRAIDKNAAVAISRADTFMGTLFGTDLDEAGAKILKGLVREFSVSEVIDAIDISFDTYRDAGEVMSRIETICHDRRNNEKQ